MESDQSCSDFIGKCVSQINPILPLLLILIHVFTEAKGHTERHKGLFGALDPNR